VSGELVKKGWTVVDASAGGVEEVAAAGQLALWLSGSKEVFDAHQPIFKAMGKSVLHVGELGTAKLVKNAMAMLAAVQHMSIVEICWLLKKGGLEESAFQAILKNSQQDSVATQRIMEVVVSRKFKPRKSWMPKDVGFGLDMAREMEVQIAVEPTLTEEAYGSDPKAARRRMIEIAARGGTPVVCTQGRVIPYLIDWWCTRDGVTPDKSRNRKGSTWILSLVDGRLIAADHLASPLASGSCP
jgi:hypothetical protein